MTDGEKRQLITKGAVEEILNICTTFEYKGQTEKLTNEKIESHTFSLCEYKHR